MRVDIIGVPIDLGANRRGVDMGPSAIRYAGLREELVRLGDQYCDLGNIQVDVLENYQGEHPKGPKHIQQVNEVNLQLSEKVSSSLLSGGFPIVLGGDHSIAVGTIFGTQKALKNTGILWLDAHSDFNTHKTSMSGNVHGMSLAASTGSGALEMASFKSEDTPYVNPEKVVIIGARSIDKKEAALIRSSGVTLFTISDIDMYGMRDCIIKALKIVEKDTEGIHVSFDMDVLNPGEAPGVGTPVLGGLTYREAHLAAELISDSLKLRSLEIVEVNPILDHQNQTAEMAVSLISSMVGRKIIHM